MTAPQPSAPHEKCALETARIVHRACHTAGINPVAPTPRRRFAMAMAAIPVAGALVDAFGVEEPHMPDVPRLALSVLWASTLDPALPDREQSQQLGGYLNLTRDIYTRIAYPADGAPSPSPHAQQFLELIGKCAVAYRETGDRRGLEGIGQLIESLAGMIDQDVPPGPFVVATESGPQQ